jgi:hypothetical protein
MPASGENSNHEQTNSIHGPVCARHARTKNVVSVLPHRMHRPETVFLPGSAVIHGCPATG